jgi:NADH-quinone oxidoreductase subunit I
LFTIQYPEQQITPPEEFRVIPFLIYELDEAGRRKYRCTACGICAKVCPTQCIWITRNSDEVTGKPIPQSKEFYIDIDKCMNCGSCAEFCPFDAIKMDHDFEISTYERGSTRIYPKPQLGKTLDYYAKIRPENNKREEAARKLKAGVN